MPTQAQINLAAYKSGKKPEEIQALLQAKGVIPNQITSMPINAPTSMPVGMTNAEVIAK